ncbi:MAG: hypothetical protein RLZZ70_252 [Candidatus Parcubacteria bacterium]|jgi:uncharacterized protein YndB with AHSA1/START domain
MEIITIQTTVQAPLQKVWDCWTKVEHIAGWAFASDDWGAEGISNLVEKDGQFASRMFAKDGSFEFIFSGKYTAVVANTSLDYILDDGRNVTVHFADTPAGVEIIQRFEPESTNPIEMQRNGWQAYLDNFKKYVEST